MRFRWDPSPPERAVLRIDDSVSVQRLSVTTVTFAAVRLGEAQPRGYDVRTDYRCSYPASLSQNRPRRFAMLNVTTCNLALATLIVLAALGPAIVDVARLAKCAVLPCRDKEPV